ncbi:RloB family protein [Massilibacteroides sp.]|uniref:RloB family protein n=1 Tax=Massilibacteroides sp. TaxID=2034766 RepID=UPI0026171FA0|nr:RloB family protein [Massilibacteroides sp.]MDD4515966.1 RloB family protein [Massilibacteroides sp.]
MTENWNYQKADSKKEPVAPQMKKEKAASKQSLTTPAIVLPATYTKQEGVRESFLFVIISGGEKREKDYFSAIELGKMGRRIKLITLSAIKGAGGFTPQQLYGYALNAVQRKYVEKNNDRFNLQENDRFFLLTDVDQFTGLKRIIYLCQYRRFNLIVSNPCFEIWLYYSYFNQPEKDLALLSSQDCQVSWKLKRLIDSLRPGGIDPRKAIGELETAIKHSIEKYKEEEVGFPGFLSTQMFLLGKDLKENLLDDLAIWKQQEQNRIQEYKKKKLL